MSTYEKMRQEIDRLKEEFADDGIEVIDLQNMSREEAVDYIRASNCDIVVSRGGAYRYIKERISRPVIPIDVTVYDIINILDFAHIDDTLLVGVKEITEFANRLKELTSVKLHILSLNCHEELYGHEEEIRRYQTVFSDYNSHVYLESRGIHTKLIESSYESVREAYFRACSLYEELTELKKRERILDAYLLDENKNVYLYQGRKLYVRRITNPLIQEEIEELIEEHLDAFLRSRYVEKCIYRNEYFIRIYNHHFRSEKERLTAVKVEFLKYPKALADIAFQKEAPGNAQEGEFGNYHMVEEEREELLLYAASSLPVVVSASDEILKRKAFSEIISHSEYRESTPFYIRFGMFTDSRLRRLFEDENSVLNLSRHVIIFEGIELLSGLYREMLKNYFLDSRILASNKIVLAIRKKEVLDEIMSAIPYHFVHLSSYFERGDKVEIIRRNLEELGLPAEEKKVQALARRRFVTEMDLKRALENGRVFQRVSDIKATDKASDAGGTEQMPDAGEQEIMPGAGVMEEISAGRRSGAYLEQVTLEHVLKILKEENGNRAKTAERLGIGRTTLWRMLKRVEGEESGL